MSIVNFAEARRIVEFQAATLRPSGAEISNILNAQGRVLAEGIFADRDFPPFPRVTRDGYAVRSSDLREVPATLEVMGEIRAGMAPQPDAAELQDREAYAIMTGAPLPRGADAVVMVEYTSSTNSGIMIERSVCPGENVVPRGAEASCGERLLDVGTHLAEAGIAIAASVGKSELRVFTKPRVAILSTGDELVDINTVPGPAQIRNSNSYSLAAQVGAAGGRALLLPIARDEAGDLRHAIASGLSADLLLLTGGVSMGKYDLVEEVLREFEAEFFFTGALIQPGRPVVFGRCRKSAPVPDEPPPVSKFFFGLPGNPVSTMVTFELFVRPVIHALTGRTPEPLIFLQAKLNSEVRTKTGLTRFLPARLEGDFEQAAATLIGWKGSGDFIASARANCYLVIPPGRDRFAAGEMVSVFLKP